MPFTMIFNSTTKSFIPQNEQQTDKNGVYCIKKYYIPAFYIILYTGTHFFVAKIVSKTCD